MLQFAKPRILSTQNGWNREFALRSVKTFASSALHSFLFSCVEPLSTFLVALLNWAFCAHKRRKTECRPAALFAHMRPASVFSWLCLPFRQSFLTLFSFHDCSLFRVIDFVYFIFCILFCVHYFALFPKWAAFPLLLHINWKYFLWLVWPPRPPASPPIRPPSRIKEMASIVFSFQY